MTSEKPITPRPTARFSRLACSASGTDDAVMSTRLSSWRTAVRTERAMRSQSNRAPRPAPTRCRARLIEARLQTATLSASCGRQTSVQRLDRWMVPVLLFRARVLMVSFHVSHGCEVVWSVTRMAFHCSRARTFLNRRSSPDSAMAAYSA